MTVIQPNKNNKSFLKLIFFLGAVVSGLVWIEVRVYSQTVDLKHEMAAVSERIGELSVENAELRNSFYAMTDQKNLNRLAKDIGLVQDKNPKWVFASQL